jgi:DNA-binding NarL/FixJ family response regulator
VTNVEPAGGRTGGGDVSVLLVDDDSMVRGWVRMSLETSEFRISGEAGSLEDAIDLVERRRPTLLLVDYKLGPATGTELVRELRRRGFSTPAVIMTANREQGFNELAREAGAQGTLLKTGRGEELLRALRSVAEGEQVFDERHPRRPPGRAALSPREREVLKLIAAGATNRDVAATLEIGEETVKTMLARAFAKLGVSRRAEAVSEAHRRGLL